MHIPLPIRQRAAKPSISTSQPPLVPLMTSPCSLDHKQKRGASVASPPIQVGTADSARFSVAPRATVHIPPWTPPSPPRATPPCRSSCGRAWLLPCESAGLRFCAIARGSIAESIHQQPIDQYADLVVDHRYLPRSSIRSRLRTATIRFGASKSRSRPKKFQAG